MFSKVQSSSNTVVGQFQVSTAGYIEAYIWLVLRSRLFRINDEIIVMSTLIQFQVEELKVEIKSFKAEIGNLF